MYRFVLSLILCSGALCAQSKPSLSIAWFDWQPCQALKALAATYPDASVSVTCVPNSDWRGSIFNAFANRKGADLVILDSQWIGEAVKGRHIQDLTQWMQANLPLSDYLPAALSAYGEYPADSGRLYGVPAQADTQVLVYRKDLLSAARFQPPATWSELLRQAQFFKSNPAAGAASGFVTHWCATPSCYDQVQTAWNQIAWSFGGELWDPVRYRIAGVLDSPANVAALEFARRLVLTGPEKVTDYRYEDVVDAMCSGRSAMATIWFGFAGSFTDARSCPQSANLGYAVVPGEVRHVLSLGGMGMSVSSYTTNSAAALQFVKWFQADAQQLAWARAGGSPTRTSILASDAFTGAAPYNAVFTASYGLVKDFWNVPEYIELLPIQGTLLNLALAGKAEPQATLMATAVLQQQILDLAYPDGSPLVPSISASGVVSGASFAAGAIAPGQVVSIFGTAVGSGIPSTFRPIDNRVGTELAGTRVLFDGTPAPVIFTGPSQVTVVAPYGISEKTKVTVQVESHGKTIGSVNATVAEAAPGIFTADQSGKGQALALNQNGQRNAADNRAAKGSSVTFFVTGVGKTSPAVTDGAISGPGIVAPVLPLSATIGGVPTSGVGVLSMAGLPPGVSALQVWVPDSAPSGEAVVVALTVGSATSPRVTIAVQ